MPTNISKNLLNLSHYYKDRRNPDILDCIANLSSDEVFTPPELADKVLDLLPEEVWSNPNLKWLDPACKTGVFLRQIAIRLMVGLKDAIPDEAERREHIFKKMLYGMPITRLTALMSRRSVYYAKNAMSDKSVVKFNDNEGNIIFVPMEHHFKMGKCTFCGLSQSEKVLGSRDGMGELENHAYQFIHLKEETLKTMKFDVIVGNPPYQLGTGGGISDNSAMPIYQFFVEQAIRLGSRYIAFIIPSRWFIGGRGLDSFRKQMLNDRHIRELVDYPDANDCFPGVDISGGVCYFVRDNNYLGDCNVSTIVGDKTLDSMKRALNDYDVLIRFNKAIPILKKVQQFKEKNLGETVSSVKPFGISSTFADFEKKNTGLVDQIKIYIRNREEKLVNIKYIRTNKEWINKYKVLLPKAYGERGKYPYYITGKPFVGDIGYCCSETYLVIKTFSNKQEAKNMVNYMKTRFFRFLVSLRKQTQNMARDCFGFVPDLPMDEEWNDEKLYLKYDITPDEVMFINSLVKDME